VIRVITARYGILTPDQRLLGEVFSASVEAEKRACELGPNHVVVLIDLFTSCVG
jgi:hypothetical protein